MNESFRALIQSSRTIAHNAGLSWDIALDIHGVAHKGKAWDLQLLSKSGKPQKLVLRTFSEFEDAQAELVKRGLLPADELGLRPVSVHWQDLIKAFALDHVVVKKKSLGFAQSASQAWRFLATVARKEPWLVTVDDVRLACEISDVCQNTEGRSINIIALTRNFVDALHLFDACPLAVLVGRRQKGEDTRAKFAKSKALDKAEDALLTVLAERKSQEKLPDKRAFWQLLKIVYTDSPRSAVDYLRFALIKLMVLTGLRVGEVVFIPMDWKRTRGYVDYKGKPAGELGGISESLSIRHFALKQGEPYLHEETQFVPDMFREEVISILDGVLAFTEPLRATLKAQFESGRVFPQYEPDQLVEATTMYVHLTGNPVWTNRPYSKELSECLDRYRATFDLGDLALMSGLQQGSSNLAAAVSRYYSKERRSQGLILREASGLPSLGPGVRGKYLLVSDVESYANNHAPTKRSDLAPLRMNNGGQLAPWEMLFLMPKRAVAQGRGDSALDLVNTYSVGVADPSLVMLALGGDDAGVKQYCIYKTYGLTEEDKALTVNTHSLRHLQNSELFRLGVSDAIITKRFNRKSVAQSYVYDHRSLAEHLDSADLPDEWTQVLGDSKAATVAQMILAGKANGPIVREFKKIQIAEGDQAALLFLMAEADGFHVTPYGTCLNSFTVDPCPKSLECFQDCRHLSVTDLPKQREYAVVLLGRLKVVLEHARAKPDGTIGKANQIAHALKRVIGVEKLLATPVGSLVFPDGVDLSKPKKPGTILDGT